MHVKSSTPSSSGGPRETSVLSEQAVQAAFHSYLKYSLTQAKMERLLDVEVLSSAESDLMITGPAFCLYFAAIRCTTNPPSVPLSRSSKSSLHRPIDLSYDNCPPAFSSFLRVWSLLVPQIQALRPEHRYDLSRIICNLSPITIPPNPDLNGIAAELRAIALEISQRRSFQDRYASALQAALDSDGGGSQGGRQATGGASGSGKIVASFVPPPVYEKTSPTVPNTNGGHLSVPPAPAYSARSPSFPPPINTTSGYLYSPSSPPFLRTPSPTILSPGISPAIEFIRETLYAALGDALELFPSLRPLLRSDPPRAYFASVSLAILFVSTHAVDFDKQAIISVLGTPLTLDECPADLRPLMRELMDIGSSALKLIEEDDELAIRALSSGQDVQEETRMERVKKILLEGVGYEYRRVGSFGGRRRSVEGRGLAFSNRIGELAVRMTALRAFRERQYGVFKVLAGIGS